MNAPTFGGSTSAKIASCRARVMRPGSAHGMSASPRRVRVGKTSLDPSWVFSSRAQPYLGAVTL